MHVREGGGKDPMPIAFTTGAAMPSGGSTRPSLVIVCPGLRLPTWNRLLGMGLADRMAEKRHIRECVSRCARIALGSRTRTV